MIYPVSILPKDVILTAPPFQTPVDATSPSRERAEISPTLIFPAEFMMTLPALPPASEVAEINPPFVLIAPLTLVIEILFPLPL